MCFVTQLHVKFLFSHAARCIRTLCTYLILEPVSGDYVSDGVLSELSRKVQHNSMCQVARELMGLTDAEVENIKTNNRQCEDASYDILKLWRKKSGGGVQKLCHIFSEARKSEIVIHPEVLEYLQSVPSQSRCSPSGKKELYLQDF